MRKLFIAVSTMFFSACAPKFPDLLPAEFAQAIQQPNTILLDVRTSEEFADGHIAGAVNIDWHDSCFAKQVAEQLDKNQTIAVYCKVGRRSHAAAGKLHTMGYTHIVELKGGFDEWQKEGMAVEYSKYEADEFITNSGKPIRFYALMHASIRIQYDGKEFEIDPCSQLGERKVNYSQMPKADYIIVTHEHHDHFDPAAIELLHKEHTQLIMNPRCVELYGSGNAMVNYETRQLSGDISIEAVPAYNITEGHLQFHPKGRDNGYIITMDGLRIYIAGDTEDITEMADIHDIDIAFLPCNQPYTMTPEQLIRAAKTIRPRVLYPYHYGQTDVSTVPVALADENIDVRIRHYE